MLTQANVPPPGGGSPTAYTEAQPSLATRFYVVTSGVSPTANSATVASIGTVVEFAGNTLPPGVLPADGRLLSTLAYADLFALIGTTFGGNGTTEFALPDLRGRTIVGADATHPFGTVFGSD